MKKKIFTLFTMITLVFTLIPNNISFASENDYFYGVWETDSEFFQLTDATDWTFKKVSDSLASGGYTMRFSNLDGSFDGEKRLYTDSLEVPDDGKYKLFVRIKGADSIKYSVNGGSYTAPHVMYSDSEYKWLYMKEIELFSSATLEEKGLGKANIISFAPHKLNTYFDKVAITNDPLCYPVGTAEDFNKSGGFSGVYPAPEVYPQKKSHPRVFINKNNLDSIKNNLEHEQNKAVYESVLDYASKNFTGNLTQGVNYNNYNYNALECAKANAFLYLMDGDESKALKAVSIMTNYLSTLKYAESGSLMEIRGTGTAIVAASIVYDWCYDASCFTAEMKEKLVSLCISQANSLECGWPPVRLHSLTEGHSQENSVMKDVFAFAIAVYDEYPEIYDLVGGRMFAEYIPYLNNRYKDADTMHSQGDNYGVSRFKYELYPNLLLRGMGYDNVIDDNQLYMAYQQIVRTRPDGATFNDGDIFDHATKSNAYTVTTSDPALAFYASVLFEDSYMKGYFQELMPYPEKMSLGDDFSPVLYLALNNTSLNGNSKYDLPLTVYGGDTTGMLTARTSWKDGKNSNAMLVSMKLPENWRNNHQHLDAGNFEIYYKGPLAIDSGLYTSAGNTHDINYNKRTIAHNTILVNDGKPEYSGAASVDGGQRSIYDFPYNMTMDDVKSDKSKAGEIMFLDWGEDLKKPSYTYFKGDMTNWYSDKVSLFERSFMFLNFFDDTYPGALIVFDKVVSSDETYEKKWLLHSQQEPVINGNVTTIVRNENGYNGKLINETLLPKEHTLEIIGGEGKEYYYGGVNYPASPNEEKYSDESGNWRIELSPENPNEEDYFLNVLTVCENNDEITPLDAEFSESDLFFEVKIKDRICYFAKGSSLISDSFVVENTDNDIEYSITGLEKGTWQIKNDSTLITKEVTGKGSVLNFKIDAGTYEIKKINNSADEKSLTLKGNISKRNAPFIECYPYCFATEDNIVVFAKTMFDYGYDVKEYGFMYAPTDDSTIDTEGVRRFPSKTSKNSVGQFGIELIDKIGALKEGHLLKTYIIYDDNGEEKVAYGSSIDIKK